MKGVQRMKKVLSWLLILVFLCSFCCVQAMAASSRGRTILLIILLLLRISWYGRPG